QIPPSLGYEAPNPTIDFDTSPFRVNDRLVDWTSGTGPRRGAVNSLGVGGTNAHAILEEAPGRAPSGESDFPFQILCLSARSRSALDENSQKLAAHLIETPELDLADVAYTLKVGRRGFEKRRVIVAETVEDAAKQLAEGDARQVFTHDVVGESPETIFMFPGGGAQYAGMAQDLYETEPVFAEWMNRGLDHLQAQLDYDIRAIWLPQDDPTKAEERLKQPSVQLPLIMIVEYALAQLWISWGVRPAALVGHSMGENTAACLAGVMTFESAIDLVLLRGRLLDTVAPGGMLSISLPLSEVTEIIGDDLDIASVNAPGLTAVSGPQDKLDGLAARLENKEVDYQRIQIDIAAHSRMLDPILTDYRDFLRGLDLQSPTVPIISNRTGQELTAEQATSPDYWVEQLRNTVNFAECINTLARPDRVFLEVGPGKALSSLAQMCNGVNHNQVLSSLRHPDQDQADDAFFLGVIGRLWACGVEADWAQVWGEAQRNRLPLPTYAYQRSRYFIDPGQQSVQTPEQLPMRIDDMSKWGWRPMWRPQLVDCDIDPADDLDQTQPQCWLIFEDDKGVAARAADKLELAGHRVSRVSAGDTYARLSDNRLLLAPEQGRHGYNLLLQDLAQSGQFPDRIGHFWLVTQAETFRPGASFYDRNMEQGFFSLTALAQALGNVDLPDRLHIDVFTTGAANIKDEALPYPEKATIAGPAGVIPREFPGLTCATIDLEHISEKPQNGFFARNEKNTDIDALTNRILEELLSEPQNAQAALRGDRRYGLNYRPVPLDPADDTFRAGGTYLITGGFGGIGQTLAADLLHRHSANVILLSRETLPPRDAWTRYLESHPASDRT
ncbi:MAG: type I polyketide synthase, partial [Pseudomonadota bacterium]